MTLFKKLGMLSGVNLENFQWLASNVGYPSQLPMNNTPGRLVLLVNMRGSGFGLSDTFTQGLAVFDWSETKNKYVLTRFNSGINNTSLDMWYPRSYAMVESDEMIIVQADSIANAVLRRGVVSVDSAGNASMASAGDVASMNCNWAEFISAPCAGYNGSLYFGYYRRQYYPDYTGITNGWLDKITASGYVPMSSALCTGYTGSESTQGQPGLYVAMLGFSDPNGYLVVNSDRSDPDTVVRTKLVNATGTPSPGAECYWSGRSSGTELLAISASKVVVKYFVSGTYNGKLALLYTNSDSAPTTLTKGADCGVPSIPAITGFTDSDVDSSSFFISTCSNYKSKANKVLAWCFWKINPSAVNGDTGYYIFSPVIIESTSNSNITATLPTEDIKGNSPTLLTRYTGYTFVNYSTSCIGAPDDKAVVMWINPVDAGNQTDDDYRLHQQTYQL